MKKSFILYLILSGIFSAQAQDSIPDVYNHIYYDKNCKMYYRHHGKKYYATDDTTSFTLKNLKGNPTAFDEGIQFDFQNPNLSGTVYYGLINYHDSKHPTPVWYKKTAKISAGKAQINILKRLSGKYDMIDWQKRGRGTLGYRVSNAKGRLLYEGIIAFSYDKKDGFRIANTLTEGPFVNLLQPGSTVISFDTNFDIKAGVFVNNQWFYDPKPTRHHEIKITGLQPDTRYTYKVNYGEDSQTYDFQTAPLKGTRKAFTFAYASDSRGGQGGGERNMFGTNFYVMRKMMALANYNHVAFAQMTGDLIDGYTINPEETELQYANWKRAVEPFAHYFPVMTAVGNHEVTGKLFQTEDGRWKAFVPNFPFSTASPAAVFAKNFVNPHSDLVSEDGAYYDPNPGKMDFPPYDETVYYYTYDNVAVVVLNSNYLYAPTIKNNPETGGNLHGYIMDNQLKWLEKTLQKLENDKGIDHIFISHHTPAFPDGGHVSDDMWYAGNNEPRPTIAGKPVKKGIIQRRDEYLDIIINKSSKVVATLTGDEHNYNKVKITPEVNIYPENYAFPKLKRTRTIWQINDGAAGAPYYAQNKKTPWNQAVSGFSTQLALVLIDVNGKKVSVRVINPDTLETIDTFILRE